jgi:hypothetical protein
MTRRTLPGHLVVEPYDGGSGIIPLKYDGQWIDTSAASSEPGEFDDLIAHGMWARQEVERRDWEDELAELMSQKLKVWYEEYCPEPEKKTRETIENYVGACRRFAKWCHEYNLNPEGIRPAILATYLHEQVKQGADAVLAAESISYAHLTTGHSDPAANDLCRGILRYAAIHKSHGTNGHSKELTDENKGLH